MFATLCVASSAVGGCGDVTSDLITGPEQASGTTAGGADAVPDRTAECETNSECFDDEPRLCHPTLRRCVECVTDGHCSEGRERCSTELGECAIPCAASEDCIDEDDVICDPVIGYCVECLQDADCAAGELCRSSECVRMRG